MLIGGDEFGAAGWPARQRREASGSRSRAGDRRFGGCGAGWGPGGGSRARRRPAEVSGRAGGSARAPAPGDPPELDGDPGWTLRVDGFDPKLERAHESLLTLADGCLGTRGTPLGRARRCGAPRRGSGRLPGLRGRDRASPGSAMERTALRPRSEALDPARAGPAYRPHAPAIGDGGGSRPGGALLVAGASRQRGAEMPWPERGDRRRRGAGAPAASAEGAIDRGVDGDRHWMCAGDRAGVLAAAAVDRLSEDGESAHLDRIASYRAGLRRGGRAPSGAGRGRRQRGRPASRRCWSSIGQPGRVAGAGRDVEIEGDPELEQAVRLSLFHLMAPQPTAARRRLARAA